jgi:hypothetical protein
MSKNLTGSGLVYANNDEETVSLWIRLVSLATLFTLFSLTLFYLALIPLLIYGALVYSSIVCSVIVFFLLISPFVARSHWPAVGASFGFTAWRRYFALRVWKEAPLGQGRNVLFCMVPHGVFPLSLTLLSGIFDQVFPEFQGRIANTAVASGMLWTPLISPLLIWLGCIPATRNAIKARLRENNVILLPGGIAEAFHSSREEERLYLNVRKGFIKTALQEGSLLVPVYCFGHSQLYTVYPSHDSLIAKWSRRIKFSIIWFWGERWCPPVPLRVPLMVVIGAGIELGPPVAEPTQGQIDALHARFVRAVVDLYYTHRSKVPGYEDKELKIL